MNKEEIEESPYCEVCGHCGYIGCCGIRNFIEEHIRNKTNCKNEELIINELISLCEYKDEIFEENKQLQARIDKAIKYIESKENGKCIRNGIERGAYTFVLDFDEARKFIWELLEILYGDKNE